MLENHLIRQLDQLTEQQFRQLRKELGLNYASLGATVIEERIRDTTESASALFYIDMHGPMTNRFFKSNNLRGMTIPDVKGMRAYTIDMPVIGVLNEMFDRLETSFDQIRRFTADASHELKTPLSLVRLHAERLLVDSAVQKTPRESVHVQLEELARVIQIIDELLFLSRADANAIAVNLQEQGPAGFLQVFAQDAAALAEHKGRRFSYTHEGDGTIAFEDKRIRQVLLNLLANALNASPPTDASRCNRC